MRSLGFRFRHSASDGLPGGEDAGDSSESYPSLDVDSDEDCADFDPSPEQQQTPTGCSDTNVARECTYTWGDECVDPRCEAEQSWVADDFPSTYCIDNQIWAHGGCAYYGYHDDYLEAHCPQPTVHPDVCVAECESGCELNEWGDAQCAQDTSP